MVNEVRVEKQSISHKRKARRLVLQALYQWHMSGGDLYEIEAQFRVTNNMEKVDVDYFCRLFYGVCEQRETLENSFKAFLDREIEQLNPIELTVLRLSAFELTYCLEIPYKVVLDEAVAMSKEYGSQDGFRYVNGVLNNLAREVRSLEISMDNE